VDGLWIAAGHEGLGITTSLGTSRLLADLVLGRTPPVDPTPFAPARVLEQGAAPHGALA
jgi:glycine/D-amino acid oxidase-like deaminating enzyme